MKNFNEVWKGYLAEMDFDTSNLATKASLHPKFWKDDKLNGQVLTKLLEIANDFIETADIEDKIEDITMTGSLAAFNWHAKSDIDLHILIDSV